MRTIQIFQPGGPEVLTEVEIATPEAGPGEVRVKAEAIGVGRPDILVRKGTYKWMPPLPVVPGSELVGIIDQLGSGVVGLKTGQRVLVSARELAIRAGCCAEYICVSSGAVYVIPDGVDPVDAASLPNLQFANALWSCNGDRDIKSILIPGVSGGVGSLLTRFAQYKGAKTIGTTSSPQKIPFIRETGIDHLLESAPSSLPERVQKVTDGEGVDFAVDQLGGESLVACLRSLAPMGMVASINIITGLPKEDVFQVMRTMLTKSLALRTFSMHTFDQNAENRRNLMHAAIGQLACDAIRVPRSIVMPLSDIRKAHEMLDAGAAMGKIVLKP